MTVLDGAALHLSEVYGPTWQGEGPFAGRRCGFVRLGLCNLSCEWCDTAYTWDRTRYDLDAEAPLTPVATIAEQVEALGCEMVVLSGGEPLIHHRLLRALVDTPYEWHVETNGTITPPGWWPDFITHTTVSPKVNTRDPEHRRIRPLALDVWAEFALHGLACFKFVATTTDDLDTIDTLVDRHAIPPETVWIMPEGQRVPSLLRRHRELAERIMASGYNTTTRLHVLLWGTERGR